MKNLTWASGIGADGRPIRLPEPGAVAAGHQGVPVAGRRHQLVLAVVQPGDRASTTCRRSRSAASTRRAPQGRGEPASSYLGGSQRIADDPTPQRILRAIDIRTGAIAWELPQAGPGDSWGGTLATATGLVFVGEDGGALMAVDATTGTPLWTLPDQRRRGGRRR